MNLLGTLSVFPQIPARIQRLNELAYNLWWSWNSDAQALFSVANQELWDALTHNPVKFLREVSQERLNEVAADAAGVAEKFGVPPAQIADYLALVGDNSDNIPGIPKVGPKTAAKWLGQYGTLDALVAQSAEIAGKVGESLRDNLGGTRCALRRRA